MKWKGFRGEIKYPNYSASIEMMDLPEPFWQARFEWLLPESTSLAVKSFEEGKLDQAYEWCKNQINSYEQRNKQGRSS